LAVSFLLLNNNNNRFSLVYDHLIEFNQLALANAEGSDDMLNRVMTKDNIGLAALLETKEAAWSNGIRPDPSQIHQPLLVCTAHIHWDPQYCDVKLVQTMMLMNEVKNHSFFFCSAGWMKGFNRFCNS
jgi:CCR4-NOT transcription complex subunit 6